MPDARAGEGQAATAAQEHDDDDTSLGARVNEMLHQALGEEPCASACTHVIKGEWTALGVANVFTRAAEAAERARRG